MDGKGIKRSRNPGGPTAPPSKGPRYPFCNQFNEETGCSNKKLGLDCCEAPDGRRDKHSCQVLVPGPNGKKKYCSKFTHNQHNCPNA